MKLEIERTKRATSLALSTAALLPLFAGSIVHGGSMPRSASASAAVAPARQLEVHQVLIIKGTISGIEVELEVTQCEQGTSGCP